MIYVSQSGDIGGVRLHQVGPAPPPYPSSPTTSTTLPVLGRANEKARVPYHPFHRKVIAKRERHRERDKTRKQN